MLKKKIPIIQALLQLLIRLMAIPLATSISLCVIPGAYESAIFGTSNLMEESPWFGSGFVRGLKEC